VSTSYNSLICAVIAGRRLADALTYAQSGEIPPGAGSPARATTTSAASTDAVGSDGHASATNSMMKVADDVTFT
jgi:hypothetical protein